MTLDDVFQPNQYGTIPIIEIYSIGAITKYSDNLAKVTLDGKDDIYIPLSTECKLDPSTGINSYTTVEVRSPDIGLYNMRLLHLRIADSSERLIINAINPLETLWYLTPQGMFRHVFDYDKHSLLPNGTGWLDNPVYGKQPVTFYYEDILYRLDLHGELK